MSAMRIRGIFTAKTERYTPLGADAAIVFGHKNLVFRNTTSHVFCVDF
jgi:vancomycin resistance protein YoaR